MLHQLFCILVRVLGHFLVQVVQIEFPTCVQQSDHSFNIKPINLCRDKLFQFFREVCHLEPLRKTQCFTKDVDVCLREVHCNTIHVLENKIEALLMFHIPYLDFTILTVGKVFVHQ
uniref:Secreted protein n=1 Tax=Cacopsylla melanoneura TaxID=428564 RepID=A0A8D8YYD5_9HEMI